MRVTVDDLHGRETHGGISGHEHDDGALGRALIILAEGSDPHLGEQLFRCDLDFPEPSELPWAGDANAETRRG